jgi:hypothetical protein
LLFSSNSKKKEKEIIKNESVEREKHKLFMHWTQVLIH